MAHTLIALRGHINDVDKFIRELRSQYLPYDSYDEKTKKMTRGLLNLRVCPIQLYDISYPKPFQDVVNNTLFSGGTGEPQRKSMKKYISLVRKFLGFKPIKKPNSNVGSLGIMPPQNIEMIGIGVKDDYYIEPDKSHVSEDKKSDLAQEGI